KEGTYTYSYVTSGNGLNMLQSQTLGSKTISYTYDNLRRTTQLDVNGLTTSYTYDAYNRVATKTYPGSGFTITNQYNSNGFLTEVDPPSGPAIWTANYMNPAGQYVDYTLGNNVHTIKSYTPYGFLTSISGGSYENIAYDFDATSGNLGTRTEGNLAETFTYDGQLNSKLIEAKSTYPNNSTITADISMAYDPSGNITSKSDICAANTYYADGNSNNQVTQVPNSNNII